MQAPRNAALGWVLAGVVALGVVTDAAYRSPAAEGAAAPSTEFSAVRAMSAFTALAGSDEPHPLGTAANARLRAGLAERLAALGYRVELQSGWACNEGVCGRPVNVVATLGAGPFEDGILLAAHYDSVPAGPGAADDGGSVAAQLEIARIIAARPRTRHPLAILISDGEEAGLLGAVLFTRDHPLAHHIRAAVNMEARGTSGNSLMFETGTSNAWLMGLYSQSVRHPVTNSLYYVVYKLLPNDTDFTVFKQAAYQGFNFAYIGDVGRYHTPLDRAANVSLASVQHQGDNALSTLAALLKADIPRQGSGESVFFDVLGRFLVTWPAALTLPAALLVLLALAAEAALLLRAGAASIRDVSWAALGVAGAWLGAVVLPIACLAGLMAGGRLPRPGSAPWIAHPLPMHLAAAAMALLAVTGSATLVARRTRAEGLWVAASLLGALLAAAAAAIAPGASYPWLIGGLAAAAAALPLGIDAAKSRPLRPWKLELASLVPALSLLAIIMALLRFLYLALGAPAWPIAALALALAASYLMPLLVLASPHLRRRLIAGAAAFAAAGVGLTLALPTYSARWPERVDLEYWLDADTSQAHYLAWSDSGILPRYFGQAARFHSEPREPYPYAGSRGFMAEAPLMALAAPVLRVAAGDAAGVHRLALHLQSPRAASEAAIIFPPGAQVARASVIAGPARVTVPLHRMRSGATRLDLLGLPAEGVELQVDWPGSLPSAVQVLDRSYGLAAGTALAGRRPSGAAASQEGDSTVVHRTVEIMPGSGAPP